MWLIKKKRLGFLALDLAQLSKLLPFSEVPFTLLIKGSHFCHKKSIIMNYV